MAKYDFIAYVWTVLVVDMIFSVSVDFDGFAQSVWFYCAGVY